MNKNGKEHVFPGRPLLPVWLVILFFFTGCAGSQQVIKSRETSASDRILRVGVSCNAPPLIFKEKNTITGLEADLAVQLADYLGKELKFVEVPWEKQLDYLDQRKTDIVMSGMSITGARKYRAVFSTPYLRSGQIMLVRIEDQRRFSGGIPSIMNTGYKIGTVLNTTGDLLVTSTINKVEKTGFNRSIDAVKALIAKEIDVFIYDAPMVCHYASLYQEERLVPVLKMATEEYMGWAMRKDDQDLQKSVNEFLSLLSNDGRLKRSINKWIPYLDR